MNLYPISPDPKECAKYLDTKRIGYVGVKESSQLIATAIWCLWGIETLIKPTHKNHPVAKWVRVCPVNLFWAMDYMLACYYEYEKRRNKEYHINGITADKYWINFRQICRDNNFVPAYHKSIPKAFCNHAKRQDLGIDYTHIKNVHRAYRLYLAHRWTTDKITPTWE